MTVTKGRAYDAGMLGDSHPLDNLETHAYSPVGQVMCLYGDPAFCVRAHVQAPFRPGAVRRLTEWIFGDVINSFNFLDYKKRP